MMRVRLFVFGSNGKIDQRLLRKSKGLAGLLGTQAPNYPKRRWYRSSENELTHLLCQTFVLVFLGAP